MLTIDPIGVNPHGRTNPHGQTNPHGRTNAPHGQTNPAGVVGYAYPGTGGLEVVTYIGPAPARAQQVAKGGRRPVVAFVDTGCGTIDGWLPAGSERRDDIVRRALHLVQEQGRSDRHRRPEHRPRGLRRPVRTARRIPGCGRGTRHVRRRDHPSGRAGSQPHLDPRRRQQRHCDRERVHRRDRGSCGLGELRARSETRTTSTC